MAETNKNTEKNGQDTQQPAAVVPITKPTEYGGPKGPEPTRYGDWEKNGRCVDF